MKTISGSLHQVWGIWKEVDKPIGCEKVDSTVAHICICISIEWFVGKISCLVPSTNYEQTNDGYCFDGHVHLTIWRNWNARKLQLSMKFQNNNRKKVCIRIGNSGCWYNLQSNKKIYIMTQHEIANLHISISCTTNKFRVPDYNVATASRLCNRY